MTRELIGFALVLLVFVIAFRILRSNRALRSDQELRIPAPQDSKGGVEIGEALYVSTVFSSAPLERVWAHGMGVRGKSRVFASGDGLSIERKGERDIFIPSTSARGITREGATIDKGVEPGGLIAIHWMLGDTEVSTNLRVVGDIRDFIKQIRELTGERFG